jgi:hypothetical protein
LPRTLRSLAPWILLSGLLLLCTAIVGAWTDRNGMMNGFQNEFIHVGNAMDLWGALIRGDSWTARQIVLSYYWPPLFYLWPALLYPLMGASHAAMVTANITHLAILLYATFRLGEALSDRAGGALAMATLVTWPGVVGNLVRFEPNVAVTAWVTAGALCLLRSRGFADRRWSIAFGVACGVGFLVDRLSLGPFLALPAAVLVVGGLREPDRGRRLTNAGLCLVALGLVAGWWLVAFFHYNWEELLSQGGVGEIDAAGTWTEQRDPTALATWLYYGTVLLDEQAGLAPGLAALAGLGAALVARGKRLVPALVVLSGVGLFTLVQKKQVYYTLPMLGCLAALTGAWLRGLQRGGVARAAVGWALAVGLLVVGAHQVGWRMWDRGLPLPSRIGALLGGSTAPAGWADRRHPQASAPAGLRLPIDEMARAVGDGEIAVFSDDQTWFEGFLILQLRERLPGFTVRGLISDPRGTYEYIRTADTFVYVTPRREAGWPTEEAMVAALTQHHYDLDDPSMPPVVDLIGELEEDYVIAGRWPLSYGGSAVVFRAR